MPPHACMLMSPTWSLQRAVKACTYTALAVPLAALKQAVCRLGVTVPHHHTQTAENLQTYSHKHAPQRGLLGTTLRCIAGWPNINGASAGARIACISVAVAAQPQHAHSAHCLLQCMQGTSARRPCALTLATQLCKFLKRLLRFLPWPAMARAWEVTVLQRPWRGN